MNISFVKLGEICNIHDHHLQEVYSVHKNDISIREEGADNSEKGKNKHLKIAKNVVILQNILH